MWSPRTTGWWSGRPSGTHDGDSFLDVEPSGGDVEIGITTIFRIERRKIAEAWMCFDTLGLLKQVGAVFEHPQAYDWYEFGE
jgi:hypothetical protein